MIVSWMRKVAEGEDSHGELRTIEALTATSSDMDGLMALLARVRDALAEREGK